jgi:iron complex outermembrane recepter protein
MARDNCTMDFRENLYVARRIGAGKSIGGACCGLALGVALPVLPQQDPAVPVRVEKIEVTGSNISRRIDAETALPVTVITREEIRNSGVTTAAELLDKVSAINGGGYNLSQGIGDSSTPGLSAVSLRGLGSNNTLVLLNGRRLSNYAFNAVGGGTVNLNQIPLGAVERVEVLKDGASAIYGTDAIGGVINFILRKDYQGAEVTAYGAWTDGGGGNTHNYSVAAGYGDIDKNRFNVLATLEYQKDEELKASQRAFASTGIRPDLGIGSTSGNTVPANFRYHGASYNVTAAQGCLPSASSYQVDMNTGALAPLQTSCRYDFTNVIDIAPPGERKTFFTRGVSQLPGENQAFVEYHLNRNEFLFSASETPVADFLGNGDFRYPASGIYYPSSLNLPDRSVLHPTGALPIAWRLRDAGMRTDRVNSEESRLVAGFQGAFAGWDYNTAFSRSTSHVTDNYINGYVRESVLAQGFATGIIDPFSGRPQTAAALALIDAAKINEKIRDSDAKVTSFDGKISRELWQTAHGPVAIAIGADHRKEEIEERPSEVLYSGDILGAGGNLPPTTHAQRTIGALFTELNVPLLKDLEAQLAARYDRYSDFGSTVNPKVALRWTPTKAVLMRASYGTGFRAPTLSDLFLPPIATFTGTRSDPIRCPQATPVGDFVNPDVECDGLPAQFGGSPSLQPEKSRQWSFGAILEPAKGISLAVDYWSIRRRNTIGTPSEDTLFDVYAVADPLTANGHFVRRARLPDGSCAGDGDVPTPANVPCAIDHVLELQENLGKYNVSGIDVSTTWRGSLPSFGRLTFRLEGTYMLQYRYQREKDGPYFDNVGNSSDNGAMARWRHYATLNWRFGDWGATLAQNFVLGYRDEDNQSAPRRVGSCETFDLQGLWDAWRGLSVTLGVRNVFNRDPPASRQGRSFQIGYDPRYFDPRGRTLHLGLRYAFK